MKKEKDKCYRCGRSLKSKFNTRDGKFKDDVLRKCDCYSHDDILMGAEEVEKCDPFYVNEDFYDEEEWDE